MRRSLVPILCLAVLAANGCAKAPKAPPLKSGASGHIVIGPYVQPAEKDGDITKNLRFVWWTDVSGPATIEYRGKNGQHGATLPGDETAMEGLYRHTATLIAADSLVEMEAHATVTVDGKVFTSPIRRITMPGARTDRAFRFAALGDTGAGTDAQKRVVEQVMKRKPELLVITGDVVYDTGEFKEYRSRFFPYYGDLMETVPILPALGNHDVGNPDHLGRPYREVWTPPLNWAPPADSKTVYTILKRRANKGEGPLPRDQWSARNYSVTTRRCYFLCLDSTADHDTMRDLIVPWAQKDLAAAKAAGAVWFIAYWHHPPYTRGGYRDNSLQWGDIRELFVPLVKTAGVQFVLNGHDHNYQHMRKDGVNYIVTGAGGARLYPVVKDYSANDQPPLLGSNDQVRSFTMFEMSADTNTMSVRQIDENGRQLDAFAVQRQQIP